jgi:hypothetical protein
VRRRIVFRELAAFAFFVALSVLLTWPLVLHLPTAVSDFGDPLLVTWILDWVCYAITHQPLALYDAPMFHPAMLPLAFSENFIVPALLVLPLHLAGVPPVAVYNVAFLLGFALSGYGAWVLARMVSGSSFGALVAGIFYAFCTFKLEHLAHLQIVFSGWIPLLLAALLAYWRRPTWHRASLVTLSLVALGLTNLYYLMYSAVAVLGTVATFVIVRRRSWRFYAGLAAAGIAAMILLYPFLRPYRIVAKEYGHKRYLEEVRWGSATWSNWLVPSFRSRIYASVPAPSAFAPERQLFPGLAILFLTIVAVVATPRSPIGSSPPGDARPTWPEPLPRSRRLRLLMDIVIFAALGTAWAAAVGDRHEITAYGKRLLSVSSSDVPMMIAIVLALIRFSPHLRWAAERSRFSLGAWIAAVWVAVGVLGSFGANSFFYTFLYRRFEAIQSMRVPARFAIIAYTGLAVWGALGVTQLLRGREGWRRTIAGSGLVLLMIVDVSPRIRWEHVPAETPPVYQWLNETRLGPVVELPFSGPWIDFSYLLGATSHHVKILNGTSGHFPPTWIELREAEVRGDFDVFLDALERFGTRLVIVHGDLAFDEVQPQRVEWLRRSLTDGRLGFLGRFDNQVIGDYVFAVTRNLPDWQRHRLPDIIDPAGHLPQHNLQRFLEGKNTHSRNILVWTDHPIHYHPVKGPLRVSGWTLSPHGVKRVTVFFHSDRLRFEAQRVDRPDVKAAFPWLRAENDLPGFELVLPERPKTLPVETSLIVEVEDNAGRIRRGKHISFRWE